MKKSVGTENIKIQPDLWIKPIDFHPLCLAFEKNQLKHIIELKYFKNDLRAILCFKGKQKQIVMIKLNLNI